MNSVDNSLVFALSLDSGEKLELPNLSDAIHNPDVAVWTHLGIGFDDVDIASFKRVFALPEDVLEALTAPHSRPGIVRFDSGLVLTMRGRNMSDADDSDMVSLRFWLSGKDLITIERRPVASIRSVEESILRANRTSTTVEVFQRVIECLNDRILDMVAQRVDAIDEIDEQLASEDDGAAFELLQGLRREVVAIRRYLGPQRDLFLKLEKEIPEEFRKVPSQAAFYRWEFDRVQHALEDLNAIRERAALLAEECLQRTSERMNRNAYTLSVVAAIFLPLTFVSGVFGMNVGGLPMMDEPMGFVWTCIAMVILGIASWLLMRILKLL